MRTTISFSVPKTKATRTRRLAKTRGFRSVSEYLRFLVSLDDTDLIISEEELLRRGKEAERLHREGKLIEAKSLADL